MPSRRDNRMFANVVDIRSPCGTASGKRLDEETLASLRGDGVKRRVTDHGGSRIEWTRSIPTGILYEGSGIDLYNKITRDPAYYLYNDELSIFEDHSDDIAAVLLESVAHVRGTAEGASQRDGRERHIVLVDLGAGRLDKSAYLLDSISKEIEYGSKNAPRSQRTAATYLAVDLQFEQLQSRISQLLQERPHFGNSCFDEYSLSGVSVRGVCGSYHDTTEYLRSGKWKVESLQSQRTHTLDTESRKCLMWLGSSFTNLNPLQAARFLRDFVENGKLLPGDLLLVGIDRCRDVEKVTAAYSDSSQHWQRYVQNGLLNAAKSIGEATLANDWTYVARWDPLKGRHLVRQTPANLHAH
ncbi:hypothetical protein KC318_g653 [Hortaea werneckii]|nr:hypothetical protein KC334_g745 [Hortaea werneckii]KAI7026249.1 hypothetical protein KC355_g707 [Hortaea werneckii]KAI7203214.1 hypothetical protein KC324_g1367 [Hortaea werneckii]KAI7594383.1 hypothetical protein KC316_g1158 [Hortaea werneckii]KAI7675875.1 hypothetical protein KC318_g653 [Hortaea werneckii]